MWLGGRSFKSTNTIPVMLCYCIMSVTTATITAQWVTNDQSYLRLRGRENRRIFKASRKIFKDVGHEFGLEQNYPLYRPIY